MGQIMKRKKKGRPSKVDLARRAMVRRGHRRQIWRAEPCGEWRLAICGVWVVVVNGGGSRSWVDVACFFFGSGFSDRRDLLGNQSDGGGGGGGGWFRCWHNDICGAPCAIV
uniref:Uncharacterized protein n=1 Tax=Fagus sylvatica TaxID=28930 RepID=A0A2N9INC6_FAGSY